MSSENAIFISDFSDSSVLEETQDFQNNDLSSELDTAAPLEQTAPVIPETTQEVIATPLPQSTVETTNELFKENINGQSETQISETLATDATPEATPEVSPTPEATPTPAPEHNIDDIYAQLEIIQLSQTDVMENYRFQNAVFISIFIVLSFLTGLLLARIVWRKL